MVCSTFFYSWCGKSVDKYNTCLHALHPLHHFFCFLLPLMARTRSPLISQWVRTPVSVQPSPSHIHIHRVLFYQALYDPSARPVQYATRRSSCKRPFWDTSLSTGELFTGHNGQRRFVMCAGAFRESTWRSEWCLRGYWCQRKWVLSAPVLGKVF